MPIATSGFPSKIQVIASVTFPTGFTLTQFPKDSDPVDFPALQNGDAEMGVNGDLITWTVASYGEITINVIPGDTDDRNLFALFRANTAGKNKLIANDIINATLVYADGSFVSMNGGKTISYMPGRGISGEGKVKTRAYVFRFESIQESF